MGPILMSIFGSLLAFVALVAAGFYAKHLSSVKPIGEDEGNSIDWKSPKFISGYVLVGLLLFYRVFIYEPEDVWDDYTIDSHSSGSRSTFRRRGPKSNEMSLTTIC